MEFLTWMAKSVLLLPVWALIESPFIQLSSRLIIAKRLSFRAAFMLALISGGALIAANVVLWPVLANVGDAASSILSVSIALAVSTVLYGYFLTNGEGRSVGHLKGGLVVLLSSLLFGAALLILAFAVVGVANLSK